MLLEDQDGSRWDQDAIDEAILDAAMALGVVRRYQIQAAIAALHDRAPRPEDTDWPQIASLYRRLARLQPSPVIELNRAVAGVMADGPAAGLPLIDALVGDLHGYHLFHAARANVLRRLSCWTDSRAAYASARDLAANPLEPAFLERRMA